MWALGWALTIYATLYLVRPVCEFLKKLFPLILRSTLFLPRACP